MVKKRFRIEKDSLGPVKVPAGILYAAQTQRAVDNFPVSGLTLPPAFIHALGLIKRAAAVVNRQLGLLDPRIARAIEQAAREVEMGRHDGQFPLDIFQTGSATSTHMNANEVIATLASRRLKRKIHPNDHVNMSQSSNDVIPTAIHVSAALEVTEQLIPALEHLKTAIRKKAASTDRIVKTGRTHLMDAMPIRMSQELSGWAVQVGNGIERLKSSDGRLSQLAMGGTAVGTGVNAHPQFGKRVTAFLKKETGFPFVVSRNYFETISCQDAAVELSGHLKTVAVSLTKICNDLRWMNSGPLAGLSEIALPALQPGSSIMPGKVNPVIPEAVLMVCAQVIGNDVTITWAAQSGNFQLNTMVPILVYDLLKGIEWLAHASRLLSDSAIRGFKVNEKRIEQALKRNPILVTALNPLIGYEKAAQIAKTAYAKDRPILEVAAEMTDLSVAQLKRLLDPRRLTQGGIQR